jgi:hypothetical protein
MEAPGGKEKGHDGIMAWLSIIRRTLHENGMKIAGKRRGTSLT